MSDFKTYNLDNFRIVEKKRDDVLHREIDIFYKDKLVNIDFFYAGKHFDDFIKNSYDDPFSEKYNEFKILSEEKLDFLVDEINENHKIFGKDRPMHLDEKGKSDEYIDLFNETRGDINRFLQSMKTRFYQHFKQIPTRKLVMNKNLRETLRNKILADGKELNRGK